jgi:hypothetical protein
MTTRVWGFQPVLEWGLYRGELGMRHTNSRTESISISRLESLILFGFLERGRTRLVWLRFHSESVETALVVVPRRVHGSTQLRTGRRASAQHGRLGLGAAVAPGLT